MKIYESHAAETYQDSRRFIFYEYFFNANVANSKSSQTRVSVLLRVPNCRNGRIEVIYIRELII